MATNANTKVDTSHGVAFEERRVEEPGAMLGTCKTQDDPPISCLPEEILLSIFGMLVQDDIQWKPLEWIGVTHVCSHWRRIALECPRLWTCIRCRFPQWAMEQIERSQTAPLTVIANFSSISKRGELVLKECLKRWDRIRKLVLENAGTTITTSKFLAEILAGLTLPAPLLETVRVSSSYGWYDLPERVFSGPGGAPRLRTLSIYRCNILWETPVFHVLTSLSIHSPMNRIPATKLASVLSKIPNLQKAHFRSVFERFQGDPLAVPSPRVFLPNLTHLWLADDGLDCVAFYSSVIFPPGAIIRTDGHHLGNGHDVIADEPEDPRLVPLLLQKLVTIINDATTLPINHITIGNTFFHANNMSSRTVRQSLLVFHMPPRFPRIVWTPLGPLQHLRSLDITNQGFSMPSRGWVDIFGELETLESINLDGRDPERVISLLGALSWGLGCPTLVCLGDGDNEVNMEPGRLKFRHLRILRIVPCPSGPCSGVRCLIEILGICLKERRRRGLRMLRKLDLARYGPPSASPKPPAPLQSSDESVAGPGLNLVDHDRVDSTSLEPETEGAIPTLWPDFFKVHLAKRAADETAADVAANGTKRLVKRLIYKTGFRGPGENETDSEDLAASETYAQRHGHGR